MSTEISQHADFSGIRYAQCWEDADVLLRGLDIRSGDTCLSIASAGDNTLALLTADPARVVAVDLSAAQLACLRLRMSAYRALSHDELLELVGSRPSSRRPALFARCRSAGGLDRDTAAFWDGRPELIRAGIGSAGRFERYFEIFRRWVLPLVHGRRTVGELLRPKSPDERADFFASEWNTRRWRLLFRLFFSRWTMGRLGRDPQFFRYVEGSVADHLMSRVKHALCVLDPASNPYLHWILRGTHGDALPLALRPEYFRTIRDRLDRVEIYHGSIESCLDEARGGPRFDRFNLSDIFEYMSPDAGAVLLRRIASAARPGAHLLYWNMLAPRSRPPSLSREIEPLEALSRELHADDRAFFYSRVVLERIIAPPEREA